MNIAKVIPQILSDQSAVYNVRIDIDGNTALDLVCEDEAKAIAVRNVLNWCVSSVEFVLSPRD